MDLLAKNRTYHEAQSSMELLPNYYVWTYGKFRRHIKGVVVELGCGSGTGIRCYIGNAHHVYAVDYNDALLTRIVKSLGASIVTPIKADLMDDWRELKGIEADTVILMDVLEHFRDDEAFLKKAAALLKPGGRMIIKVPAQRKLYSSIDEASGHFRRYDPEDLQRLALQAGLDCRFIRHINPLGALAYRMKKEKQTNFSRTFSKAQLAFLNRLMPLIQLADHIPFLRGLSMICLMSRQPS